jgi:hypothetical protein
VRSHGLCRIAAKVGIQRDARSFGVADGRDGSSTWASLARLTDRGHHPHVGRQGCGVAEVSGVAQSSEQNPHCKCAQAIDRGEHRGQRVGADALLELHLHAAKTLTKGVEVRAEGAHRDVVGRAAVLRDGDGGGADERCRLGSAERTTAPTMEAGERPSIGFPERLG